MISPEQYKTLATLVLYRLPVGGGAQSASEFLDAEVLLAVPATTRLYDLAKWIVDQLLREPLPRRFIDAVRKVDDHQDAIASLIALADALERDVALWRPLNGKPVQDWTVETDPLMLVDGRPFVDRLGFRELLPRMGAAEAPSCLLITGDEGDGKSYLHDFCCAFAARRTDFKVAYTRIRADAEFDLRVSIIELALDLGVDHSALPEPHEEKFRDAENLATWIARYMPDRPVPALVVIDDFRDFDELGDKEMKHAFHKFVSVLLHHIQTDETTRARLRLILIDYDSSLLAETGVKCEPYVLEAVEDKHVADWFRKCFPGHPDYRYGDVAASIVKRVRSVQPPRARMQTLNQQMRIAAPRFMVR